MRISTQAESREGRAGELKQLGGSAEIEGTQYGLGVTGDECRQQQGSIMTGWGALSKVSEENGI
jgi:hypothetical protein